MPRGSSPTPWGGQPKSLAAPPPRGRPQLNSTSSRANVPQGIAQWRRGPRQPSQPRSDNTSGKEVSTLSSGLGMAMQGTPARKRKKVKKKCKSNSVGISSTPKNTSVSAYDSDDSDETEPDLSYPDATRSVNMDDDPFLNSVETITDATPEASFTPSAVGSSQEPSSSSYHERWTEKVVPANIPPTSSADDILSSSAPPTPPDSSLVRNRMRLFHRSREWDERLPRIAAHSPMKPSSTGYTSPVPRLPPMSSQLSIPMSSPLDAFSRKVHPAPSSSAVSADVTQRSASEAPFSSAASSASGPKQPPGNIMYPSMFVPMNDLNSLPQSSSGDVLPHSSNPVSSIKLDVSQNTPQRNIFSDKPIGNTSTPLHDHLARMSERNSNPRGRTVSSTESSYSTQTGSQESSLESHTPRGASHHDSPSGFTSQEIGEEDEVSLESICDQECTVGKSDGDDNGDKEEDQVTINRGHASQATTTATSRHGTQDDFPDMAQAESEHPDDSQEDQWHSSPEVARGTQRTSRDNQDSQEDAISDYHGGIIDTERDYESNDGELDIQQSYQENDGPSDHDSIGGSGGSWDESLGQPHYSSYDDDDLVDPWGYFSIWNLARNTKPEPYCPSSESSTSSTVGHRRRREPTRSPLVFSSSPEPEGGSRASRRPSSRALWSSPPPPVTNKKRKIWRGGRMLERMMGRASPRPDSNVDTVSTSESEADPAPSRKRICVEPSLSEAALRAREARINHYKDLEDNYELHFG